MIASSLMSHEIKTSLKVFAVIFVLLSSPALGTIFVYNPGFALHYFYWPFIASSGLAIFVFLGLLLKRKDNKLTSYYPYIVFLPNMFLLWVTAKSMRVCNEPGFVGNCWPILLIPIFTIFVYIPSIIVFFWLKRRMKS